MTATPPKTQKAPTNNEVQQELSAMHRIVAALEPLDAYARRRVITYIADRYDQFDFGPPHKLVGSPTSPPPVD